MIFEHTGHPCYFGRPIFLAGAHTGWDAAYCKVCGIDSVRFSNVPSTQLREFYGRGAAGRKGRRNHDCYDFQITPTPQNSGVISAPGPRANMRWRGWYVVGIQSVAGTYKSFLLLFRVMRVMIISYPQKCGSGLSKVLTTSVYNTSLTWLA